MPIGKHLKGRYHEVRPTPEEVQEWRRTHPRQPPPYRVVCEADGTRLWWSGLGRGAHERGNLHAEAVRPVPMTLGEQRTRPNHGVGSIKERWREVRRLEASGHPLKHPRAFVFGSARRKR